MKNVLLVEDDLLSQQAMGSILKKHYNVDFCGSADEFYSNYSKKEYDIIIMDISLSGDKDGLQLTREIKKMPLLKDVPVLCVTAHAFSKDKKNAYEAGVDFYLSKPVSIEVLNDAIEKLLKHKKP